MVGASFAFSSAVHPRVCGELQLEIDGSTIHDGSSPRVRGTPGRQRQSRGQRRFIPACAGNSPHDAPMARTDGGSSPRVRGTPRRHHRGPRDRRFIPACGELALALTAAGRAAGSSPRVRGTRWMKTSSLPWKRFIPACAGNSFQRRENRRNMSVHPRVCGELANGELNALVDHGSSPRVRGTPKRANLRAHRSSVHPRVCGELVFTNEVRLSAAGSSPRVRGTHENVLVRPGGGRFIPACAGNSPC